VDLTKTLRRTLYNAGASLGLLQKAAPFIWPVNSDGRVQWQLGNFLNYVEDGFMLNPIIYATIMYKVRAVTQATPVAYVGDPASPTLAPIDHPLSRLLRRPNPYMSWEEMQGLCTAYLNISGNAYLILDRRGSKGGIPTGLYPIRPDEMFILPKSGGLEGYLYVPRAAALSEGIPLLVEDVIHVKFPNPADMFQGLGYGLSPMSALSRSGDVDNQVTRFLKIFFERGAMPAGLLKYDIPLDRNMVGEIKARWRQIYGGMENWAEIGVLDKGGEFVQTSQSFKDMGFDTLDERNEARIIGPFGVPPMLIGTRFGMKGATFSNYEEARRAFWEDTMTYELRLFETELKHYLVGQDGAFPAFNFGAVPALRQNVTPLVDAATKLFAMGVPADLALATVGLRLPKLPYGDVAYLSNSIVRAEDIEAKAQQAAQAADAAAEALKNPEPDEDEEAPEDEDDGGAESSKAFLAAKRRLAS
jgi:HK97 family phage portal protein